MPSYTAPDPNLVAFDPSAVTGGIGQSFQLASMLEQVKAQRQKKALMDAIMQSQIEAENAKNNQITQLAGPETQNKLKALDVSNLKFNAEMPNIAPAGLLEGKKIAAATNMVQPLSEAEIAAANAKKAESESALNLNALSETAASNKLNSQIKDYEDIDKQRQSKIDRALAENAYAKTKNTSEEASFEADSKLRDEKTRAEIEALKATAKYHNDLIDTKRIETPAQMAQAIGAMGLSAKRAEDAAYALPSGKFGNLAQYREATRDPEVLDPKTHQPTIKISRFGHSGFGLKPVNLDKNGEEAINELENLKKGMTRYALRLAGVPEQPSAQTSEYKTADEVKADFHAGKLNQSQAEAILQNQFGFK